MTNAQVVFSPIENGQKWSQFFSIVAVVFTLLKSIYYSFTVSNSFRCLIRVCKCPLMTQSFKSGTLQQGDAEHVQDKRVTPKNATEKTMSSRNYRPTFVCLILILATQQQKRQNLSSPGEDVCKCALLLCLARCTSLTVWLQRIPPNPPPKPIRRQSTISHPPREFPLCLMQISHVLHLFISLHYLGSAKCHIRNSAYYLWRAVVELRTLILA